MWVYKNAKIDPSSLNRMKTTLALTPLEGI